MTMNTRIVLAYAGGLDTAAAIAWLADYHHADVVTVTLDLGQPSPLEPVRDQALAAGAIRAHVLDAREEFGRQYVLPLLHTAESADDVPGLLRTASRALIARKTVDVAVIEQADAVACVAADPASHSAFEDAVQTLDPRMRVIAVPATAGSTSAAARPRPVAVPRHPETPAHIDIAFERGAPVSVSGVAMDVVELAESLATIADGHGVGGRSRTIYDGPAAALLHTSLRALEALVPSDEVTGVVRLRLFQGACEVVGCTAGAPLPSTDELVAEPL